MSKKKTKLWGCGFFGKDNSIHYGFRNDEGTEVYVTYRKIDPSVVDNPHWMDDPMRGRTKREVALDDSVVKELHMDFTVNRKRYRGQPDPKEGELTNSCHKELPELLRRIADLEESKKEKQ